jgi:GGDEF domain-containing protein
MTASIGAAVAWPAAEGTASEKLLAAADSAMYSAKNAGRDQLIVAGQVIKWPKALA